MRNSHILDNVALMDNVCEMSRKVLQNKHKEYKFKLARFKTNLLLQKHDLQIKFSFSYFYPTVVQ